MRTTRLRGVFDMLPPFETIIGGSRRSYERMKVNDMISRTEHELRPPLYLSGARRVAAFPQNRRGSPYLAIGGFPADQRSRGRAWCAVGRANRTANVPDASRKGPGRRGRPGPRGRGA